MKPRSFFVASVKPIYSASVESQDIAPLANVNVSPVLIN